ncbi:hypothetical protein PR1_53 [Providencia phage vB_PreS_PR1]|uniref:Uncharacterized protein n=1 Tax=Providencia phage vB_PreS_PR1 TaxID=1931407 RepID=A0A1S6KV59_9CAUD|nr:hypothetical protein FDH30_gp054 [Providencia phage vB_PreS_PR1]AQT25305.1 hypothetical protein PR1_53 [Providencia phage vB_PreS_PR1]
MKEDLYVVHVRYQPSSRGKEYAYLYDPSKIPLKRGDEILVPVGSEGKQARCEVSRVKGLMDSLNKEIKYKILDPEDVNMSIKLLARDRELEARKKKLKDALWDDTAHSIEDF